MPTAYAISKPKPIPNQIEMQTKFVSVAFGFRSHLDACADGVTILLTQLNSQPDRQIYKCDAEAAEYTIFIESSSQLTPQT